jgi:hypothetical protein
MNAVPLDYIAHLDPEEMKDIINNDDESTNGKDAAKLTTEFYKGPIHEINDPQTFPSVSEIINESRFHTGVCIPEKHCKDFDIKWRAALGEAFSKDPQYQEQLLDYIKTGRSNGRKLYFQVMQLPPGMFFKIHAHPNIEFELTLKGCLEEFRFLFRVDAEELRGDNSYMPKGPDITKENANYQHLRVEAGKCMLNEIGSVHQSFTGNKGPCALIVMWSGCHANTHPSQVADDLEEGRLQPTAGW